MTDEVSIETERRARRARRRNALGGVSLVLFFLFSEPIPFGPRLADAPSFFTVNAVLPAPAKELPMALLLIPSAIFLGLALGPLRHRGWDGPCFALTVPALAFYVLVWRSGDALGAWYLWLLLLLPWVGLNLWARSIDYFYASCVAAPLWDMGAAIFGLARGMPFVPEPYAPRVPPKLSVALDVTLVALFAVLWLKRVDWGEVLGIERLRALDEPGGRARRSARGDAGIDGTVDATTPPVAERCGASSRAKIRRKDR